MSSGKMERYNVTGLVNNGRLVGRFPFCLKIKWNMLISGMLFLYFEEFDTAAQISSFSIRQNKSRLESRTCHFGFGGGFCSSKTGKQ
jgi:high-affinity nickel permease